jgi:hypothetical protein
MNEQQVPIGIVRFDELLKYLNALAKTGGCDLRTLHIVATGYGLEDFLIQAPAGPAVVIIETPRVQSAPGSFIGTGGG